MDPNVALANLRTGVAEDDMDKVTDALEALDGWLRRGGFLPADWDKNRPVPFTTGPMYAVHATYERPVDGGWTSQGQVPLFYLDPNAQGFLDEAGAEKVGRRVLEAGTRPEDRVTYHVTAVRL